MKTSRACGDEEALGSNVFDYGRLNKMNQFNKTLEAIISHIGRTYTQSGNIISSIRMGSRVVLQGPQAPVYQDENTRTAGVDRAARTQNRMADLEYVEGLKEYNKKQTTLDTNIKAAYSLVWGQCTPAMQAQIKTQNDFQTIRDNFDVFALLKAIKGIHSN